MEMDEEDKLSQKFESGTTQEKLKILDQQYKEILKGRIELDSIKIKEDSGSIVQTLDQGIFENDRDYYRRSPLTWTPVRSLKFNNISKMLAESLQKPIKCEIGFTVGFKHKGSGGYEINVLGETLGSEQNADVWGAAEYMKPSFREDTEGLFEFLSSNMTVGFGHTHPKKHIYSGTDMEKITGGLFYRPHLLINPACDAIVYLPIKGFYFVEKSNISIKNINKDKKVPKVI